MRRAPVALLATCVAATAAPARPQQPDERLSRAAAAYAAKVAASALFVSGRSLESVLAEELAPDRPLEALIRPLLRFEVDRDARVVTCRLGAVTATAVATVNLGCTLVPAGASAARLRVRAAPGPADPRPDPATTDWPLGDRLPSAPPDGIDLVALGRALDAAFAEPRGRPPLRTRAVVVVHRGRLVGERYADGYAASTPLPGWSMSKTLVDALVGIRVRQGRLDLDAPLPVPEWATADDARRRVRLPHLLAMHAGLAWVEDYDDPASDALRMLFDTADHGAAYANQPVAAPPGTRFVYASGATNLICRILRTTFANDEDYWAFPRQALFAPLAMRSAVLETDPSGTFVGSSYGFATARDWARFGMLYAQEGVFGGVRILPDGWVERARAPAEGSGGRYGSQVWLNLDPDGEGPARATWPDLPTGLLHLDGHQGQYCIVLPEQQLVVVRLGCTNTGGFDMAGLVREVLAACTR